MKKAVILIALVAVSLTSQAQQLQQLWKVDQLQAPESVIHHAGHFYVSNVSGQPAEKNGQGFISKINKNGDIVSLKWVTGFNAPKGLGIYPGKLYVADIDRVGKVDLATGTIERWIEAKGATFLNDIEVSETGSIYVSDTFGGNRIYHIKNGQIETLVHDERLNYPNGLKLKDDVLYIATWGVVTNPETFETEIPGSLLALNLHDKSIHKQVSTIGNLDGLVKYKDGFIISDWISGDLKIINGQNQLKDLVKLNSGTADISFMASENLLLVPVMLTGELIAYRLD